VPVLGLALPPGVLPVRDSEKLQNHRFTCSSRHRSAYAIRDMQVAEKLPKYEGDIHITGFLERFKIVDA
jgi:hypothetical protein